MTCPWRIHRRLRQEFGISLDSGSATDTTREQSVTQFLPQSVPVADLPALPAKVSHERPRFESKPLRELTEIVLTSHARVGITEG